MTRRTVDGNVCSRQRKIAQVVIELCRGPCRRGVARRASVVILSCNVVRILHVLIILFVTGPAFGRRSCILSVHVTGGAVYFHVRARQWEIRICMIEGRRRPRHSIMTLETLMRELSLCMVRVIRFLKILLMARPTIRGRIRILAVIVA